MNGSGLTTIAHSFRQVDAGLAICALEAAGFRVFAPHFQISGTTPHFAIAYGGIPIQVHNDEARDAIDFLNALEVSHSETETPPPAGFRRGWIYAIREIFLYLLGGSRPPAGLFLRSRPALGHNEL